MLKTRYICVKSIHKGISYQDNLLHLCWNFDSVHNWNGILSIGSLLKIAKTKRTKIKTTDAIPCQSICLSHQMVAASYSGKRERSIFFLFESFGNAWVMGTDDIDAALFCLTDWKYKPMENYYCEYCGHRFVDARQLVSATCPRHPDGSNRGRHKLYEGTGKSNYTCKYCGHTFSSIMQMVGGTCAHHPKGSNKGAHAPAL